MTGPTQNKRRMRRGGGLALITVVVLLALAGGAYAIGHSTSDTPATTASAQRATDAPTATMMTWAQRHNDELTWMRTHHANWNWMRAHHNDLRWMRNHPDSRNWMRGHPDAWRSTHRARLDIGSPRARYQQREQMHDGWHQGHQRR